MRSGIPDAPEPSSCPGPEQTKGLVAGPVPPWRRSVAEVDFATWLRPGMKHEQGCTKDREGTRADERLRSASRSKDQNAPPDRDHWRTTSRPDIPSSARIYDYFLGSKDHYPANRDAADQITAYLPNTRKAAHINRALACRAVRYLANEAADRHPHRVADDRGQVPARLGNCYSYYYYALGARRPWLRMAGG